MNKNLKFVLYAIGLVFIIIFGIFFSNSFSSWKESNKLMIKEYSLANDIKNDLIANIEILEAEIMAQTESLKGFNYIMKLDKNQTINKDSIAYFMKLMEYKTIPPMNTSAFESLEQTGIEIIQDPQLKEEIIKLFKADYAPLSNDSNGQESQYWSTSVLPIFQKYFRIEDGNWISNDNNSWINDNEFLNMLSISKDFRKKSINHEKLALEKTKSVILLIEEKIY